jgi:hypothetical protein
MEQSLGEIFEIYFKKRTTPVRRKEKRRQYYRGKKTNFPRIKARHGYVRFKLPGTNRYILLRQTAKQRQAKHRLGIALGKAKYLRRNRPKVTRY